MFLSALIMIWLGTAALIAAVAVYEYNFGS
jgi:hypothetical protein